MSTIHPRKGQVLVKKVKTNNTTESGIVLPNSDIFKNIPMTVIEVGVEVEDLKSGDLVIVDDLDYHEAVDGQYLVEDRKILATVEG